MSISTGVLLVKSLAEPELFWMRDLPFALVILKRCITLSRHSRTQGKEAHMIYCRMTLQ